MNETEIATANFERTILVVSFASASSMWCDKSKTQTRWDGGRDTADTILISFKFEKVSDKYIIRIKSNRINHFEILLTTQCRAVKDQSIPRRNNSHHLRDRLSATALTSSSGSLHIPRWYLVTLLPPQLNTARHRLRTPTRWIIRLTQHMAVHWKALPAPVTLRIMIGRGCWGLMVASVTPPTTQLFSLPTTKTPARAIVSTSYDLQEQH